MSRVILTPWRLRASSRNCDLSPDWAWLVQARVLCLLAGLNEVVVTISRWVQLIAAAPASPSHVTGITLSSANDRIR